MPQPPSKREKIKTLLKPTPPKLQERLGLACTYLLKPPPTKESKSKYFPLDLQFSLRPRFPSP